MAFYTELPAVAGCRERLSTTWPVTLVQCSITWRHHCLLWRHHYVLWRHHSMASLTTSPSLPRCHGNLLTINITMATSQRRRRRPVDIVRRLLNRIWTKVRHWGRHRRWRHYDVTGRDSPWRHGNVGTSFHSRICRRTSSIRCCVENIATDNSNPK